MEEAILKEEKKNIKNEICLKIENNFTHHQNISLGTSNSFQFIFSFSPKN